jgi:hypothetical protein
MHSAESNNEIFKIDESTPFKSGVFFMQDDFFVDVHEHADPPMNPYEFVPIEEPEEEKTLTFAEELLQEQIKEMQEGTKKINNDEVFNNTVLTLPRQSN